MANGETTAALQAMLMQLQTRAAQVAAEASSHETNASIAQRQMGENEGLRNKNLARRDTSRTEYQTWDTRAKDFTAKEATTKVESEAAQAAADEQRNANSALEGERNARIAELRNRVQGGLVPGQAAQAATPSPQRGGTYVPPVKIDPVVAVDPALNDEQKRRASELVDAVKGAGVT